ncbi:Yae1 family protein [Sporobolomyces salmoneus]|uniref:Yae1 family protein n=1 Tax=Sporobolomyces salmoneus TaxID=183962 RepID=UPI00317D779F
MSLENDADMNDYDPWLDEDESQPVSATGSTPSSQISEQEWDKLSSRYSDAGYRDGITAGKNAKLQTGFDQGFALAAPYARELGALRGIAASLLSLLTTASGAKHASTLIDSLSEEEGGGGGSTSKEGLVTELREIVNSLGKLDAIRILPVDEEAEEHAKSHEDEGISQQMRDRKEMREMEDLMSGIGGKAKQTSGMEECRERLARILAVFGMEQVLPPARS